MFCGNCGKQIEDGTAFCPHCGSKVTGGPADGNSALNQAAGSFGGQTGGMAGQGSGAAYGASMTQEERKYRTIGIAAVVFAVLVVLVAGIAIWQASTGPKAVLRKFVQGIEDGKWEKALRATDLNLILKEMDTDDLEVAWDLGLFYDVDEEEAEDMKASEFREYVLEEAADVLEESMQYSGFYDYDIKLKMKVLESEKLSAREIRELEDSYAYEELGVEIQAARRLTVRMTISGDMEEEDETSFVLVKSGGKWYVSLIGTGTTF